MHPLSQPVRTSRTALQYSIDARAGIIVIELLALEDGPALLAALGQIADDPAVRSLDVCVICNSLKRIPSCEDVRRLARICLAARRPDLTNRWALIATWRPLNEAARFFARLVYAPNVTLRVFEAFSDAELWLRATKPDDRETLPWMGPSRELNAMISRSSTRIGR